MIIFGKKNYWKKICEVLISSVCFYLILCHWHCEAVEPKILAEKGRFYEKKLGNQESFNGIQKKEVPARKYGSSKNLERPRSVHSRSEWEHCIRYDEIFSVSVKDKSYDDIVKKFKIRSWSSPKRWQIKNSFYTMTFMWSGNWITVKHGLGFPIGVGIVEVRIWNTRIIQIVRKRVSFSVNLSPIWRFFCNIS